MNINIEILLTNDKLLTIVTIIIIITITKQACEGFDM